MTVLVLPALSAPEVAAVVIPAEPAGATRSWRRMVTSIDPAKDGAYALQGCWLRPGVAYDMPVGAIVVTCDQVGDRRDIRMWQVAVGGLVEIKAWSQKAPLGPRVVGYVARRLPAPAATASATALEHMPNRWDSWCAACHVPVPAGTGAVVQVDGRNRVLHTKACPPRRPRPNRYPGRCRTCRAWVEEGAGLMVPDLGLLHAGDCPVTPVYPANRHPGWCADCGGFMAAGDGIYQDRAARHPVCPPRTVTCPTWRIRRDHGPYRVGQTLRQRIAPRPGEMPVPSSAPGFRVIDDRWAEAVVTVVETVDAAAPYPQARVRAATWEEAETTLVAELRRALDVRPVARGFRAVWQAERIGPSAKRAVNPRLAFPWLAEITGRTGQAGYRRTFLEPMKDYRDTNNAGSRGIRYCWTLTVNRVYQAQYPTSWSTVHRAFLRATPEGDVVEITAEEVETWLNVASEWMY